MLTEDTIVDRIEVDVPTGNVLVRRATFINRDGARTDRPPSYHRSSYEPGQDVSHEDPRVQAIAAAAWTPALIAAAAARRAAVPLHLLVNQESPNDEAP